MEDKTFDYREARRECMGFGLETGLCWSVCFLCSMYGAGNPLVGNAGLLAGLFSVYHAGRRIKGYNLRSGNTSLLRTWWMAFLTYVFSTLCATLVEYAYFRWLDGGMFAEQVETVMRIPSYRQMAERMGGGTTDEMMATLGSPSMIAYSMFLLNTLMGLVLSVPTMLIGGLGLKRDGQKET